ncbi:MAG TPA: ABC transporter ATP-binding protein [Terriglobia bacterium]|nr:ABC transporter ATP-binding protein [Terriglobia bacterium]
MRDRFVPAGLEDPAGAGGAVMQAEDRLIVFENVSKFYGEVLGVNRVSLSIEPGVTSLVGPNGAGKTTLMNLMTGLLFPTKGTVRVLGISPSDPETFYRNIGYCSQFDAFPKGLSGYQMIRSMMALHGLSASEAEERTWSAIERVGMTDAAHRRVAGYSKGMRQRVRLAQALAHSPKVLILDEPLNGLDPMARSEVIELFRKFAESGMHVVISSHIMHEVDIVSDSVIMMSGGYVVAEGDIQGVRHEMEDHPIQILIRCDRPAVIASSVFQQDSVVEVRIDADGRGLLVSTRNPDRFYELFNRIILQNRIVVEAVAPADENVNAVYQYLVGSNGVPPL